MTSLQGTSRPSSQIRRFGAFDMAAHGSRSRGGAERRRATNGAMTPTYEMAGGAMAKAIRTARSVFHISVGLYKELALSAATLFRRS